MADAQVDEGAGTFKFIKIKKFIRGNSEWKKYIYIYIYLRPAFPIFEEKRTGNSDVGMEAEGVEREEDSWSAFPLPRNGPKRYYNYFTRTGIIKTETDASPGEKQARLECITLTVKTLSHARLVSPDFWRKFRVPFILPARPTFSLETKKENSNRNGK